MMKRASFLFAAQRYLLSRFFFMAAAALIFTACSSSSTGEDDPDAAAEGDREEGEACEAHADCAGDLYCALESGCSGEGVCSVRPTSCPQVVDPVCGCDGRTYQNACDARSRGVNVRHEGECTAEGASCGTSSDCDEGEVCVSDSCGELGSCEPLNTDCSGVGIPTAICACDGALYPTICDLAEAGATAAPDAVCLGEPSGCKTNADCGDLNSFCKKPSCDAPEGVCTTRPEICRIDLGEGVCGCDGETYASACAANSAGVNVRSDGPCEKRQCHPVNDQFPACGRDEYCALDPNAGDLNTCAGNGFCEPRPNPDTCGGAQLNVCGCDGKKYQSECHANAAGVRVSNISSLCDDIGIPIDPPIYQ